MTLAVPVICLGAIKELRHSPPEDPYGALHMPLSKILALPFHNTIYFHFCSFPPSVAHLLWKSAQMYQSPKPCSVTVGVHLPTDFNRTRIWPSKTYGINSCYLCSSFPFI